jgi:site-specific recombinase XerD
VSKRSSAVPTGQLAPFAAGFRKELVTAGYSKSPAKKQLNLMVNLDSWLESEGINLQALASKRVEEFFTLRREEGRANLLTARSMAPLVGFLHRSGVISLPEAEPITGEVNLVAEQFAEHLRQERGLVEGTITFYRRVARRFLADRFGDGPVDLGVVSAGDVTGFVTRECRPLSISSARQSVSALRSFLRFARMEGLTTLALDQAVLSVAGWNPSLPRAIEASQVDALLASCDRRRAIGRRDYAILILLARLGLRGGEVVALELGDINWRDGQVLVRGKRRRRDHLPLSVEVGEALAGYLRLGRPASNDRRVFVRHFAPHVGLEGSGAIRGVLARACRRAGLGYANPHRLRHTVATGMLAGGADLSEIGLVLRQSGVTATAIYAKVDHSRLSPLALDWPEVTP